jgi:dTDP-glucose 4,6-dehydratase
MEPFQVSSTSIHLNLQNLLTRRLAPAGSNAGTNKFFEDFGVWKEAPVLIGSTKFEPLPEVKNIMITGGAGFM